jgi:uncharacterized OB-fold protein
VTANRPRPVPDLQSAPYWKGLLRKVLLVQECGNCAVRVHPSLPCCPRCLNTDLRWVEVCGDGVVVGFCVVAQQFVVGFKTPYSVIRVSLCDAPEVEFIANIASHRIAGIEVGARVHVWYDVVDDDLVLADYELAENAK